MPRKGEITPMAVRRKISDTKKNQHKKASMETRAKMSFANSGRTVSEETKQKISFAKTGKYSCEKAREKIRILTKRIDKLDEAIVMQIKINLKLTQYCDTLNDMTKLLQEMIERGKK